MILRPMSLQDLPLRFCGTVLLSVMLSVTTWANPLSDIQVEKHTNKNEARANATITEKILEILLPRMELNSFDFNFVGSIENSKTEKDKQNIKLNYFDAKADIRFDRNIVFDLTSMIETTDNGLVETSKKGSRENFKTEI